MRQASTEKPTRANKAVPKEKATVKLRFGRRILIEDLRVGDEIVTVWKPPSKPWEDRSVAKSQKVTDKEECPSQWRTHTHINRKDCYDERHDIWIVDVDRKQEDIDQNEAMAAYLGVDV